MSALIGNSGPIGSRSVSRRLAKTTGGTGEIGGEGLETNKEGDTGETGGEMARLFREPMSSLSSFPGKTVRLFSAAIIGIERTWGELHRVKRCR